MVELGHLDACEPQRWSVVFHRKAANRFFSLIAMGHFKHVSAFAWLPELRTWLLFDVGFRRTRIVALPDTAKSKAYLAAVIDGNAIVSMPVRDDALPIFRTGLFCTTAIKHLIGLSSGALRPDALFRHCLSHGGELSDDAGQGTGHSSRSQSRGREARGEAGASLQPAD
jgi:hypothetical protein